MWFASIRNYVFLFLRVLIHVKQILLSAIKLLLQRRYYCKLLPLNLRVHCHLLGTISTTDCSNV